MNIELLQRVKTHILEEPRRLSMNAWFYNVNPEQGGNPPCETVGCIAGWADFLKHGVVIGNEQIGSSLELTGDQRKRLFYAHYWPEPFWTRYIYSTSKEENAKVTADRIDHFIATEGRE
jgi:hypothetical protein